MTIIEFLFAVVSVANTVLLSCVLLEVRAGVRAMLVQGSTRRAWARHDHD